MTKFKNMPLTPYKHGRGLNDGFAEELDHRSPELPQCQTSGSFKHEVHIKFKINWTSKSANFKFPLQPQQKYNTT